MLLWFLPTGGASPEIGMRATDATTNILPASVAKPCYSDNRKLNGRRIGKSFIRCSVIARKRKTTMLIHPCRAPVTIRLFFGS